MKEKINKVWNKVTNAFRRKQAPKDDYVYPLEIPVAGIRRENLLIDPDDGVVVIEAEHQIIIEESDRYKPWKMYNSFGFNRSFFLPEGVRVDRIDTKLDPDSVKIGWPKSMNKGA
ncbi:MAG: Hsp20/alpha crystallin family protein [Crocinitomicaceae bacterium]|nr:Hsp20/alpha crystallin family protein [Crocinitomicaceae bacterium]